VVYRKKGRGSQPNRIKKEKNVFSISEKKARTAHRSRMDIRSTDEPSLLRGGIGFKMIGGRERKRGRAIVS